MASVFGTGEVASLGALGEGVATLRSGGEIEDFGAGGVDVASLGVHLLTFDGLVKALSLFSLSSLVMTLGRDASLCSTRFLFGAKTTGGLREGSRTVGIAAFRCSSMSMRGATVIVLLVVTGLNPDLLGAKIPGRPAGFWKWPIALASFRN